MHSNPGYTVSDLAQRFRVGEDKVRTWIRRGELTAINTADVQCGKPRYVVTPDSLAAFERRKAVGLTPKATRRKPPKSSEVDYYP